MSPTYNTSNIPRILPPQTSLALERERVGKADARHSSSPRVLAGDEHSLPLSGGRDSIGESVGGGLCGLSCGGTGGICGAHED